MKPAQRLPLLRRVADAARALVGKPQVRSYAAAQVGRLTQGWSTVSASANADILRSLDKMRARSRQLSYNDEYVKKWMRMVEVNVVGKGFGFQARVYNAPGVADTAANDAIESAFARWAKKGVCDVTGQQSLAGLEQLAIKAAARDGEYLFEIVRGAAAENAFGLALLSLDIDRLDTMLNRASTLGVNAIRMGVEINAYGRPLAYWLRQQHPGDSMQPGTAQQLAVHRRVPAEDIIHGFVRDRPEQVRGVPWCHAAMARLNNLGGYEEAAVIAARVGASKMGFFTTPDGQAAPVATGSEEDGNGNTLATMDADPGVLQTLPEGVQFQAFNPDYPTAMYGEFVKANLRGVASGLGVAYHALANDLEGVSFSSIRSGTLEERDMWMSIQEWFAESFLERVHGEFMTAALGFGQIRFDGGKTLPISKAEKFNGHIWQARRWEWVDPLKDVEADITAMKAGLKSPQMIAAKLGLDYEDLLAEIKVSKEMADRLGLKFDAPAPTPMPAAATKPSEPAEQTPSETE